MKLSSALVSAFLVTAAAASEETLTFRSLRGADESGRISGTVQLPESAMDADRETQGLFNGAVCTGIERLLGGTVECACTPEILAGTLSFDCDTLRDVTIRDNIVYTPSFTGLFALSLANRDISFGVGYCLDGFTVDLDIGDSPAINVGDVCFAGQVKLEPAGSRLISTSLESCTFTAGSFGVCDSCVPCETSGGQAGFSVSCDFVEVAACVPLALPVSRSSRRVRPQLFGEQIADGMIKLIENNLDRFVTEEAEPEAQVAEAPAVQSAEKEKKPKKNKKPKKPKKNKKDD
ncbi:hypothetical protein FisN_2Hh606 [Fistulifera solaris]|jgi:hypothetical protein|uniref:Uncharacterized protein n=1 Tax=Fistulifera solaris TaxID=1519565 RepID=A0A1Z5JH20_FISSO|nr:hypothetical protein FisN_2Hh606 [Fistulifera solaris]|eukprot:GAX13061.1 hypothetical protein FisN_2Hh606 [Fistulifera solaris]